MAIDYLTEVKFLNADSMYNLSRVYENSTCRRMTLAEFQAVRAKMVKPFLPQRFSVTSRDTYSQWDKVKRDAYVGMLYDTPEDRRALQGLRAEGSFVRKESSKLSAWLSARRSGKIVLNPMLKYRFTVQEVPNLSPIDPTKDRALIRPGDIGPAIGVIGRGVCGGAMENEYSGFPKLSIHSNSTALRSPMVRTYPSNINGSKYFGSESEIEKFGHQAIGRLIGLHSIDKGLVTSVRSAANSGLYDVLTEVMELPETVKYIYGVIKEILTLFRTTRKEVLRLSRRRAHESEREKSAQLAEQIASLWLQFRYAVMPLVHSANSMLDLLAVQASQYLSFRDGSSERIPINLLGKEYDVSVSHRCFIKRRFSASGTELKDHLKFDAMTTAWELVPLSFVVDWALNVGDFLSSLGVPSAVQQEAATYSWKTLIDLTIETPVGSTVILQGELYEVRVIDPGQHLSIKLDPFMDVKRTLDALSLSWLAFRATTRK